ncbi:hypothetical protein CKO15_08780 [Halorhodospira abdelmalekii]|uniref:ABC-type transport auxiliary lipoprotein family protein n=1 Tax=Halorhodospira abdelmalekii TaxID=421629 RepID=UPI00190771CB|nr:ABC-type transport auxiliary lipoprotein family protein [Halorhodospira abdelmalekii]MBK1735375.1 hypothetical protein [Halorhodospira abdelmalekii]
MTKRWQEWQGGRADRLSTSELAPEVTSEWGREPGRTPGQWAACRGRRAVTTVGVFALLGLLSGCGVWPEPRTYDAYRLTVTEAAIDSGAAADSIAAERSAVQSEGMRLNAAVPTLRLTSPRTDDVLSSNRIAVLGADGRVSSYEGARWVSAVPKLWRDALLELFRDDGRLPAVVGDDERLNADWELRSTLHTFHLVADTESGAESGTPQAPLVRIVLDARWVDPRSQRLIAVRRFTAQVPVTGAAGGAETIDDKPAAAVRAFAAASRIVGQQVVDWTWELIGADE